MLALEYVYNTVFSWLLVVKIWLNEIFEFML